jgi:hypothetical protein
MPLGGAYETGLDWCTDLRGGRSMPTEVIERPSFSVVGHRCGPVFAIMRDGVVIANIRLDASTIWTLQRTLLRALKAQALYEYKQQ